MHWVGIVERFGLVLNELTSGGLVWLHVAFLGWLLRLGGIVGAPGVTADCLAMYCPPKAFA
jgi:hypothetical protein